MATADTSSGARAMLEKSSLYQEFLAEREEILRHKWLESEKAGCDVGMDTALTNWMFHHRSKWRKERKKRGVN